MGKKQLWEKDKMLVTSISSFSHNVSKRLLFRVVKELVLYDKELNAFLTEHDTNNISLDECNTILCAYTLYRHLGYYCTHPSISIFLYFAVIRLDGSVPVKYGIRLNMDEKYKALKKELSSLTNIPGDQIQLVEILGPVVKVL